jgi:hypothetical protein
VVSALTNPALYASLGGLVTAITALVKIFQIQETQAAQHETLRAVQSNTDGQLTALHADVRQLTANQATPQEVQARVEVPRVVVR